MKKIFFLLLLYSSFSCENRVVIVHDEIEVVTTIESTTDSVDYYQVFIEPNIDSIMRFVETSGAVEYSPSDKYFNPSDSGLYVFYSLFEKDKRDKLFNEMYIGSLITHTFYNENLGWSKNDDYQTFISISLERGTIFLGDSIYVGMNIENFDKELGEPIISNDSLLMFLGKDKYIAQLKISKKSVSSIIYGRYNLPDSIYHFEKQQQADFIQQILNK